MWHTIPVVAVVAAVVVGVVAVAMLAAQDDKAPPATGPAAAPADGAAWQPGQPYVVRKARGPITIDDKPHPEQWKHAMAIKGFVVPITHQPAKSETEARMLYDDQNLYIYVFARDQDLRAKLTKRTDPLWNEDVVELFLKPSAKPPYYEFEVNPIGTVMALAIPDRAKKGTLEEMSQWETGIQSAVRVAGTVNNSDDVDDFYVVLLAIPFKNLQFIGGKAPPSGEAWKFSFCRYDYSKFYGKIPEESASAPLTTDSFHRYEDYSTLKFE